MPDNDLDTRTITVRSVPAATEPPRIESALSEIRRRQRAAKRLQPLRDGRRDPWLDLPRAGGAS